MHLPVTYTIDVIYLFKFHIIVLKASQGVCTVGTIKVVKGELPSKKILQNNIKC